jgi:hypothetical protein
MSATKFEVDATGKVTIDKDPGSTMDYVEYWTAWCDANGTTLVDHEVIVTSGADPISNVAKNSSIIVGKTVVVWISGGQVGERVKCRYKVVDSAGRIDYRTVYLKIRELP